MQHRTPAELLRFLEEEATTLQLINAKIANQLHWLQVEEELFNWRLSNLEKDESSVVAIDYGQTGQDVYEELFNQKLSSAEKEEAFPLAIEYGQSGQGVNKELFNRQVSSVENDDASVLANESGQNGQGLDEEQFNRQLSDLENYEPSVLAIESGQSGQDLIEDLFDRQLWNVDDAEPSVFSIESNQSGQDLNHKLHVETDVRNEIESGEVEMQSIALSAFSVEALGSSPKPLQIPGTKRFAGKDGQEANEIIALETDHNVEMEFQGQRREHEALQVKEENPLPQRSPRKRVSRRPARFRD